MSAFDFTHFSLSAMNTPRHPYLLLAFAAFMSLLVPFINAQTYDFTFAAADQFGNASWNEDANWTGAGFPAAAGAVANVSDANFGSLTTYSIRFQGDFNDSTVGILNIDLQQSNSLLRFTGGAAGRFLTFSGTVDNPAALNFSGTGRADTTRRFEFASDTTVSVTGGKFEFNGGAITGAGNLSFTGGGGVTEITTATATGGSYSGNITISSGALVQVNGELQAHSTLSRTVTVGGYRDTGRSGDHRARHYD